MSSTRYAKPGSGLVQSRYASSPEYTELRGLNGNLISCKAALLSDPRKRSLLFFLQAMSMRPGGLPEFAKQFLAAFPERFGTPTMHRAGLKSVRIYSAKVAAEIMDELGLGDRGAEAFLDEGAADPSAIRAPITEDANPRSVEELVALCREQATGLDRFLTELCINPRVEIQLPGDLPADADVYRSKTEDLHPEPGGGVYKAAGVPFFREIVGALIEYQDRHQERVERGFVQTAVAREVFATLDFGLATGKMVVIEGREGVGKTEATKAWCEMHLGEARFVSLSGISNKTSVFRAIAKSLGLASGYSLTTSDLQSRIEDMLERSQLVLVVDEAHFLFGQGVRIYSQPELVDWVDTALYNRHVPVALVCTPQFTARLQQADRQVGWNAGQFRRRCKRFVQLPENVSKADLEAVTRKLLPEASRDTINFLVGYAGANRQPLSVLVDAVDEARLLAKAAGREQVIFDDSKRAVYEFRIPSDQALARTLVPAPVGRSGRRGLARTVNAPADKAACKPVETPAQPSNAAIHLRPVSSLDLQQPFGSRSRVAAGEPVEV